MRLRSEGFQVLMNIEAAANGREVPLVQVLPVLCFTTRTILPAV